MTIDLNPNTLGLPLTTVFTLIGGLAALAWMVRQAPSFRLTRGVTYAIALRTMLWAILGARVSHLIDFAGFYAGVPFQVFYLWSGGLSAWGALLAGAIGAIWHAKRRGASLGVFADYLTLAGLGATAAGRIGDLLAGERMGTATSVPWAVTYTNAGAAAFDAGAVHPVAAYELLVLGAITLALVVLRRWLRSGWAIAPAFAGYAVARFAIGFVTVERTHLGLGLSQWIALAVFAAISWYGFTRRGQIFAARDTNRA
jgi:phosphatidylglycerol:prolipoprotein diacylglycerol transferase